MAIHARPPEVVAAAIDPFDFASWIVADFCAGIAIGAVHLHRLLKVSEPACPVGRDADADLSYVPYLPYLPYLFRCTFPPLSTGFTKRGWHLATCSAW